MNSETTPPTHQKADKLGFFKSPLHLLVLLIVLVSLVALAAVIYDRRDEKSDQETTNNTQQASGPSLSFSPAKQTLKAGETLMLAVWEDSGEAEVNAVQAKISFPTDKFEFVSVKPEGSAFEIEAESSNKDGEVTIARGHVGQLTGRQLIAMVELKAKDSTGASEIKFINNSHLVSAVSNQDILISKETGIYSVEANQ